MSEFKKSLHRSANKFQDHVLEEAKSFVGNWLLEQENFEEAVDWLFNTDLKKIYKNSGGSLAIELVIIVVDGFQTWNDEFISFDEPETEDGSTDPNTNKSSLIYDRVSEYFGY